MSISSYFGFTVKPDRGDQIMTDQTFTIFMQVRTTPAWLAKPPERRFAFLGEVIEPILKRHPSVRMRFFDTELYSADVTDVIVWETKMLKDYQAIVEALRETPFWGQYFEVVSILPGVENAYADAYERPAIGQR
jgi:hypothetical protein